MALCARMCANVGLGPIFADLFHLDRHFCWESGPWQESAAGMWQATLGAVIRKGARTLYKHLVSWCSFFCLMSAVVGVDTLTVKIVYGRRFDFSTGRDFKSILASTQECELLGHACMTPAYICRRALQWMGTCMAEVGGTQMVAAMGVVA